MSGIIQGRTAWWAGLMFLAAASTSGCVALLVGGAAGGGYYVGKDQRSVGQISDDAAVTARINARYARDPGIKGRDIDVDTYEGVVTLHGTVPTAQGRDRAVAIAKATKGVKQVVSKLIVAPGN